MKRNRALSAPFLRLYALTLLFFSANAMLTVIVPLRSEALGASGGEIGLIMGAYMFTCMFFRPWAGHLVHRHGPARVLRVLLVVNGGALMLYALSGLTGYLAARVLQGICTAFFSMALQMGVIDALPEEQRAQGLSMYSLFTYLPAVLGPLLAIWLWTYGGMGGFSGVIAVLALGTAALGLFMPLQMVPERMAETLPEEIRGTARDELATSWRGYLRTLGDNRALRVCGLLMLLASVVFGAVVTFVPLYAAEVTHGHAGVYLMIQAAVIVLARLLWSGRMPSDGRWRGARIGGICLLGAAGALLLALGAVAGPALGPPAFYAAPVLIGIAQALLYPTLTTYLTFALPRVTRNVGLGLFIATADLGIALGGMALGPLTDIVSYSAMYAVCALLALLAACAAWLSGRGRVPLGASHTQ
ncbi:MFS transporter [Paenibacillus sp. IB182496]|uniref:MFS transporter n=1 Tax=Paenibacillus sabuli TaxID=2772509 RepID=A0A927BYC8_9BACL|nr:MFS transporter [Paenibacillus sabuli]MBD2847674.1 MFS transporter [Paenibacillus sabuli]